MFTVKNALHIIIILLSLSKAFGEYPNNNQYYAYQNRRTPYYSYSTTPAIPLTELEEEDHLVPLLRKGWLKEVVNGMTRIRKDFIFQSFYGAFSFMTQLAMLSERLGHFPEWFNVYKIIKVTLTTRHIRGLSMKDIQLAQFADRIYDVQKDI